MISFYFFNHQYKDYLNAKKNNKLLNSNNYSNNKLESNILILDKYISTYGFVF